MILFVDRIKIVAIAILALLFIFLACTVRAQDTVPVVGGITQFITPEAAAWLGAVVGLAIVGVPMTQRAVAFLLARSWFAWVRGDNILILSFVVALIWSVFWFQPGLLNVAALKLLPGWMTILVLAVGITVGASGGIDLKRQNNESAIEAQAAAAQDVGQ